VVSFIIYNIGNKNYGLSGSKAMKRLVGLLFIIVMNICFTSNFSLAKLSFSHEEAVKGISVLFMVNNPFAFIDGDFCLLDSENVQVEPIIVNGRTLIPVRFLAENFGFKVEWNEIEYTVTMFGYDKIIRLRPGSYEIKVNGSQRILDVMPEIIQNRVYVPLRVICEIIDKKVSYKSGVILVTDDNKSIEDCSNKEFAQIYFSFVREKIISERNIKPVTKYEAATYFVNHILEYYNKSIPNMDLYFFPDYRDIPEFSYYHCNLSVYLNLLKVEKGDFEPFRTLSDDEIEEALSRFEELLEIQPDLDFVNTKEMEKDLSAIINNVIKNETDIVRVSVYDFATGTAVSYNGQERFYPASLSKIVNLLCFLEEVQKGNFSLSSTYTLKQSDKYIRDTKVAGTGNLQYQANGTKYTYEDILSRMVSLSDNVAANIIFDALGREKLDAFCEKYGLKDTRIYKKFYDGDKNFPSNYSTADDLTRMLVLLENRLSVEDNLSNLGIEHMKETVNKDRIALYAPEDVVIANKVGFISRLSGDMALVYFPDREPIALTIVVEDDNRKAINQEKANELIGTLSREIIDYFKKENGPSLYIDGNLIQDRIGLRFINGRPYIKGHSLLEGYLKESKIIGKEQYISLDSLAKDNNCTYLLKEYPQKAVCITNSTIP